MLFVQKLSVYYFLSTVLSTAMTKRAATTSTVCKRPAKKKEEKLKKDAVGCNHPTEMQSAAGSNKYKARMTCLACGKLLHSLDRDHPDWERMWHGLTTAPAAAASVSEAD